MKTDDLSSEAWSNSRDTGEHAFPELGGGGPHVYAYDVRNTRHFAPTRLHRVEPYGGDKSRSLQLVPILYEIDHAANEVRFPGRQTRPVPYQQGERTVLEVSESARDPGQYYATVVCSCKARMHVALHNWRRKNSKRCRACQARSNGQSGDAQFNPRPVTVGEKARADAERMRKDPMSAVGRSARREASIVPFYKLGER